MSNQALRRALPARRNSHGDLDRTADKTQPDNEPPAKSELRRNDLLVAAIVLFALFLAFGIRNQVLNASESVRLGENLPRISYPPRWQVYRKTATAPCCMRSMPAAPAVLTRSCWLPAVCCAATKRWRMPAGDPGIKLASSLNSYRELASERMTVRGDQPALVTSYAYIADPTLDMGATGLPVVVEAQDIVFLQDGQLVIVTWPPTPMTGKTNRASLPSSPTACG